MEKTLLINREMAEQLITMDACIGAMKKAFEDVSSGDVTMLQRTMLPTQNGNKLGGMPALNEAAYICGSKVIVFASAEVSQKGTAQGIIPLFSSITGQLLAIVDAKHLTKLRTAASTAAATDALARKDATTLALLGSGRLAQAHLEAISLVRDIQKVYVWNYTPAGAKAFCEANKTEGKEFVFCETAEEAVQQADIACTVSRATTPILKGEWLQPGVHVNGVGACAPNAREVDSETVLKCTVFTDQTTAAVRDGGDLAIPIAEGVFKVEDIAAEVGEVMLGKKAGRTSETQMTFFESVGLAVQDLSAAYYVYEQAKEKGVGTPFAF